MPPMMHCPATPHSSWALALRLLVCALPLLFTGCKSASGGSYEMAQMQAMAPGYGGEDGGDYEYEYDSLAESPAEDMKEVAADAPMAKRQRSAFAKKEKDNSAAPSPTSTATTDSSTPAEQANEPLDVEAPALDEAPVVSAKRQVIYTASMQVSVYDVPHAIAVVEALPDRFGGWLNQRIDNQIVLRIPAERLQEAMAVVAELGVVDYRLLEALDVTAEYTDLDSRIRVLEQMQAHLQALLKKAESVEQALEIRRALDDITLELEAARAQMREMARSIAFSTLVLRLVERGPANELPSSNDPFGWVDELGVEATDYR